MSKVCHPKQRRHFFRITILALSAPLFLTSANSVSAAGPKAAPKGAASAQTCAASTQAGAASAQAAALSLYNQRRYLESADAFEAILKSATPEPRLFYYAGLANLGAKRTARAQQIFEYILKNFSTTPEAGYATTALDKAKGSSAAASSSSSAVPANSMSGTAAAAGNIASVEGARKKGAHPFTAADIARDGARAIDQTRYPNCWFEASMAALAELPRGQRLLANMITYGDNGKYVIRFPGDGVEYVASEADLDEMEITDKAKWAGLIEYAQIKKFPDNRGAEGAYSDQNRLEVGLGCITGCKAEILSPKDCSPSDVSSFIQGAVRSQNPVVCGTWDDYHLGNLHPLVISTHAYTIIGFDPARNMITIRNPHGAGARRFSLPSDPQHLNFEQLGEGTFKMSVPYFQNYFYQVARSFI